MRRLLLSLGLLVLCLGSLGAAPLPQEAPDRADITFRTWPPGAQVFLDSGTRNDRLGSSGDPISIDLDVLRRYGSVQFRFEHAGYRTRNVIVDATFFNNRQTLPDLTEPPLRLEAVLPVVIDLYWWGRLHPLFTGSLLLGLVLGGLVVLPPWFRRRARLRASLHRARQIEAMTASADMTDPLIKTSLGGYRIVDRLGQGGMATVYLAVPEDTLAASEAVALKVISRDLASDKEFTPRFNHEVRACRELRHPCIVQLFAAGEQDGMLYMALERIHGDTLRERIRPGGLPLDRALCILRPIIQGTDHAHSKGFIHRDLKPDNVMITKDDEVKVMDFGLARRHDFSRLTGTDTSLGTPAYMSPEQIMRGKEADHRTDQYAIGMIAYELLCGRKPWEDEDPMTLIFKHVSEAPPPLRDFRPDLPPSVEAVVMKMIAKAPDERYPRLVDALEALERAAAVTA